MNSEAVLALVGASTDTPLVFVPGDAPPRLLGHAGGSFTRDGRAVANPRAYRAAGGKVEYRLSTWRVEVGVEWLAAQVSGQANT